MPQTLVLPSIHHKRNTSEVKNPALWQSLDRFKGDDNYIKHLSRPKFNLINLSRENDPMRKSTNQPYEKFSYHIKGGIVDSRLSAFERQ